MYVRLETSFESIPRQIEDAVLISRKLGVPVMFEVNGVRIYCGGSDDVAELYQGYLENLKANKEIYSFVEASRRKPWFRLSSWIRRRQVEPVRED